MRQRLGTTPGLLACVCTMLLGLGQISSAQASSGAQVVTAAIPPGPTYWVSARHDDPHIMLGVVAVRRDGDLLTYGGAGGWCFTGVRATKRWFAGASATDDGLLFFQMRLRIHGDVLLYETRRKPGANVRRPLPFYRATRNKAAKVARMRGDTLAGMLDDCPTREEVAPL